MITLPCENDIRNYSFDILKASKSLDIFPTPVDNIVAYAQLIVSKEIDISKIRAGYFSRKLDVLKRGASKVRGALDWREKMIYLDLSQKKERKNFVKLHEVAHAVLPWQKTIHDLLDDDDDSLNVDTIDEFEAEANFFASLTLFQHNRFTDELNKLGLGIESPMHLAKYFGGSIHASLRRYVECSKNRCALIVLENKSKIGEARSCGVRNVFQSDKFSRTFGNLILPIQLKAGWSFVNEFFYGRRFKNDGVIYLPTDNGEVNFHYHFFNNTYNAFVFIFPFGEKKSTRTNIIVHGLREI